MTDPADQAPLLSGRSPRASGSARRAASTGPGHDNLGTSYLGSGLNGIAVAIMAYELILFLASFDSYARPGIAVAAWLLVAGSFAAIVGAIRSADEHLPSGAYAAFLLGIAGTVVLDIVAVSAPGSAGAVPTAAVAAATAHTALVVHRRGRKIIAVAAAITVVEAATFAVMGLDDLSLVSVRVGALVMTATPAIVAVVAMRGFRRMVQLEIDRALVQSTTLGPRYAVGMLASEELARLDLAAERLLAEVGDGRTPLPLGAHRAALAASLATQLRLHLIEGRKETWLHHAVIESELLSPLVELDDPDGTAGLLDHEQRDGLLSAIWLILDGSVGPSVTLRVEAGSPRDPGRDSPGRTLLVPLALRVEGVPLRGLDPATWEAIAQVGAFRDVPHDGGLRIEIDCLVENPADR